MVIQSVVPRSAPTASRSALGPANSVVMAAGVSNVMATKHVQRHVPVLPVTYGWYMAAGDRKPTKKAKSATSGGYSAEHIQVLEGLDPVRKRPGMYIGSTGPSGLHHLVWEAVDNSVDEAMAGYATRIDVTIQSDGGCRVVDNGRGIPVDINKQYKLSGVEIALTKLH